MRNKRLFIVLGCAVIFGLLAVLSVTSYLAKARGYSNNAKVVVAKVDIPLGTKIIAEQLSTVSFPRGTTPEGTFDNANNLVGRVVITNVAALEPFTNVKLAPEGSAGGLSAVIPEGYRAMTVKVDDVVGLSGFLMPGALVDVVVVIDPAEKSGGQNMVSKIVLQNIKVLASGFNIDRPKNDREAESVKTVTLQVTPDQAEKLALASTEGKVRLMMRNGVDQSDQQTAGATKRSLLTGEQALPLPDPGISTSVQPRPVVVRRAAARPAAMPVRREARVAPVAAPAPARMYNVEIFEGAKKRTVDFP